ncbi:MAG: ParD-like family protein [Synergistaceae bacterium]|nr:ParD-like family protein [Synergistaceae bacterium]
MIKANTNTKTKTKKKTKTKTKTVRISVEMYDLAYMTAEGVKRSVTGQIEYWARLGRAAEDNSDLPIEFIRDILISKGQNRRLAENFKAE